MEFISLVPDPLRNSTSNSTCRKGKVTMDNDGPLRHVAAPAAVNIHRAFLPLLQHLGRHEFTMAMHIPPKSSELAA